MEIPLLEPGITAGIGLARIQSIAQSTWISILMVLIVMACPAVAVTAFDRFQDRCESGTDQQLRITQPNMI